MEHILEALMGYNPTSQRANRKAVIRIVTAYLGMAEVQARNSLHLHLLAWAKNVPSLEDIRTALREYPGLIDALSEYIDSLCKTSCSIDGRSLTCNHCGSADLEFLPVETLSKPSRPLAADEPVPHFITCKACNINLDAGEELTANALDVLRERAAAGVTLASELLSSYELCKEFFLARPGPPPTGDAATVNAALVLRALHCQSHDPRHRKTCFKGRGLVKICRFRFPRGPVIVTGLYLVNADGSLTILSATIDPDSVTNVLVQTYRDQASALVNNFCPFITMMVGCNNDVRVLVAADGSAVSYYTSKYTGWLLLNPLDNWSRYELHIY